eukprot:gene39991-48889_t
MARLGAQLHDHILRVAKDVFLEMGFERASMDVVAARSETSKRTLYAHFTSKENLFLAVIELVRGLLLARIRLPGDHADDPVEALTLFCGRYLEALCYESSIRMLRISMAESERFPQQAATYFDVGFAQVHTRLSVYLAATLALTVDQSDAAAQKLLGQLLYPRLPRALLGLDPLARNLAAEGELPAIDLAPIRSVVQDLVKAVEGR